MGDRIRDAQCAGGDHRCGRVDVGGTLQSGQRAAGSVSLVAVSKTMPSPVIREALHAGQRVFGENRVQETSEKWPDLRAEFKDVRLHLIGPLQTNKIRDALKLFDVIETLDRERLAAEISREIAKGMPSPDLLVQINTGNEEQKAGIDLREADAFIARCRKDYGLNISGLMCIPPVDQPPSPHFAMLAAIAERNGLKTLSMGMSGDYYAAIQLGATHVRIGSAIFGARSP